MLKKKKNQPNFYKQLFSFYQGDTRGSIYIWIWRSEKIEVEIYGLQLYRVRKHN